MRPRRGRVPVLGGESVGWQTVARTTGFRPGGEEYRNGTFCPRGAARAYTPREVIKSGSPRFFTRTCVWRNLSKATTVVPEGDHREGPT
ncbi:hypothetical protein ACE1SV_14820 [Streptomyces sennicomposti]